MGENGTIEGEIWIENQDMKEEIRKEYKMQNRRIRTKMQVMPCYLIRFEIKSGTF